MLGIYSSLIHLSKCLVSVGLSVFLFLAKSGVFWLFGIGKSQSDSRCFSFECNPNWTNQPSTSLQHSAERHEVHCFSYKTLGPVAQAQQVDCQILLRHFTMCFREVSIITRYGANPNFEASLAGIEACNTALKNKFSIKGFLSKYDQIFNFLRIWSDLLKKSLLENFTFRTL